MTSKTVSMVNGIANILKNIQRPKSGITKGEAIDSIENNIQQLNILKEHYSKLYIDNFTLLDKYTTKLKGAKQDYSIRMFNKKVDKYRSSSIQILSMMAQADVSIEKLNNIKNKLIAPATDEIEVIGMDLAQGPDTTVVSTIDNNGNIEVIGDEIK